MSRDIEDRLTRMIRMKSDLDRDKELMGEALKEIKRLRRPFRNVDDLDWQHLAMMLPNSGHGRFWKDVLSEIRVALANQQAKP